MSKKFTVGQPLASGHNITLCISRIFLCWHAECFNVTASTPIVNGDKIAATAFLKPANALTFEGASK